MCIVILIMINVVNKDLFSESLTAKIIRITTKRCYNVADNETQGIQYKQN